MKKLIILAIVCVIFVGTASVPQCFCAEEIVFCCGRQEFTYNIANNTKKANNFYEDFELNKYNRFGTTQQKKELLAHMLNLGFETRVAVEYIYPNISKVINKIERTVNVKERNASLKVDANSKNVFLITPHVVGKRVDTQQIYENLAQKILTDQTLYITVTTSEIMPETVSADYQKFTHLRADFSTSIASSSADRKHNVKNALNSLNMVEVLPNETFSFNACVGRRTKENGYRQAKIIVGDEFVDG
ncbi:MAG: VanW family protein, partial [Clostridia bacterium]|nr:VanW family protein [Clostridia bacterium]